MAEQQPLARRVAAEGVGSFLLSAVVIGSGIMAETLARGEIATALLANSVPPGRCYSC